MDRKLWILGGIFLLTFLSFMSVIFLNDPIARLTRAANPNTRPSLQTSLVFAWPLNTVADGKAKSEITIFIRDTAGRGLEGQQVRITSSLGMLAQATSTTDSTGKATFNLTSTSKGIANIEAFVDNTRLLKTVTVQFK
ncbi:Ig-like domain-containing protein [Candidatus Woesebacteria bacterium]|nr:Ig-like domain-containing protein [Candidatus Woesebacteria bacterium]